MTQTGMSHTQFTPGGRRSSCSGGRCRERDLDVDTAAVALRGQRPEFLTCESVIQVRDGDLHSYRGERIGNLTEEERREWLDCSGCLDRTGLVRMWCKSQEPDAGMIGPCGALRIREVPGRSRVDAGRLAVACAQIERRVVSVVQRGDSADVYVEQSVRALPETEGLIGGCLIPPGVPATARLVARRASGRWVLEPGRSGS